MIKEKINIDNCICEQHIIMPCDDHFEMGFTTGDNNLNSE